MRDEFCGLRLSSSTVEDTKGASSKAGNMDDGCEVGLHVAPDEDPEEYGKVCLQSDLAAENEIKDSPCLVVTVWRSANTI